MYDQEKVLIIGEKINLAHFSRYNVIGVIGSVLDEARVVERYSCEYLLQVPSGIHLIVSDETWDFNTICEYYVYMKKYGLELGKDYVFFSMIQYADTNIIYKLCVKYSIDFFTLMKNIIGDRRFVVFWGNCQMHAVANLIINNKEFDQSFFTCKIPRFWITEKREIYEGHLFFESKILKMANFLFTQEVGGSNKYGFINSTEFVISQLTDKCKVLKVTKLYFEGYFPQLSKSFGGYSLQKSTGLSFGGWIDKEVLKLLVDGHTPEEIVKIVSAKDFYSYEAVRNRIRENLNSFNERENKTKVDIGMADYLYNNYDNYVMFATENHPTRRVMLELSYRILKTLGIKRTIIEDESKNEICYPCPPKMYHLIYPAVLGALGLKEIDRDYYSSLSLAKDDIRILGLDIYDCSKWEQDKKTGKYNINLCLKFDEYIWLYAKVLSVLIRFTL